VWPWFRSTNPVAHRRIGRVYVFAGVLPAGLFGLVIGAASSFGVPADRRQRLSSCRAVADFP